jgi:putative aminopeptidase FrvX
MKTYSYELLRQLCSIHAPSGNESAMTSFILDHVQKNSGNWNVRPEIYSGGNFGDAVILVFGKPRTAVFAHMDSVGFTAGYNNKLIRIGGPKTTSGYLLSGSDSSGSISGELKEDEETGELELVFERAVDRGTDLTFKPNFRESESFIQSCSIDNRLGVWVALKLAETLMDGAIVFSCYEEHGGGSASYLGGFLFEKYGVRQALISDITWVTSGVLSGAGVAVSLRDSGIPRKAFTNRIRQILDTKEFRYQLEVESAGGSDGNELQRSPYPFDWCFIGAPEEFVHSPDEKVHKADIQSMVEAYQILMKEL